LAPATEHDWVVLGVDNVKAIYSVPTAGKDGDDDSPRDAMERRDVRSRFRAGRRIAPGLIDA
jgi:hypothetical protein